MTYLAYAADGLGCHVVCREAPLRVASTPRVPLDVHDLYAVRYVPSFLTEKALL